MPQRPFWLAISCIFPEKRLPMQHPLIGGYLNIPEHERVIADPQGIAAGGGDVPQNDFPGYDIGELFNIGIIGHIWIEI